MTQGFLCRLPAKSLATRCRVRGASVQTSVVVTHIQVSGCLSKAKYALLRVKTNGRASTNKHKPESKNTGKYTRTMNRHTNAENLLGRQMNGQQVSPLANLAVPCKVCAERCYAIRNSEQIFWTAVHLQLVSQFPSDRGVWTSHSSPSPCFVGSGRNLMT